MKNEAFLDIGAARKFIVQALEHYAPMNAPGWFIDYLDMDIYVRLSEQWSTITLDEIMTLQGLYCDGDWKPIQYAVNTIYKMFDRLGRDTRGMMDH